MQLLIMTCHQLLRAQERFQLRYFRLFPYLQLCRGLHWDGGQRELQTTSPVTKPLTTACSWLFVCFLERPYSPVQTQEISAETQVSPLLSAPASRDLRGNRMLQYKRAGYTCIQFNGLFFLTVYFVSSNSSMSVASIISVTSIIKIPL